MEQSPKKPNKWLSLINIPIQMGAIIYLFSYLGNYLDEKYAKQDNLYTKILVVVGVFIALYNVNRQVKDINRNE
jgi:predicted MFS family arabinose efflux permease